VAVAQASWETRGEHVTMSAERLTGCSDCLLEVGGRPKARSVLCIDGLGRNGSALLPPLPLALMGPQGRVVARRARPSGGVMTKVQRLRPSSPTRTRAWRLALSATRAISTLRSEGALPDLLIVGAQRAGTTSIYEYLTAHPGVRWPRLQKGIHYFTTNYAQGIAWYRQQFPSRHSLVRAGQITGEASPYYLFHPYAAARIGRTLPEVRILVVLRDPVTRAWSHYNHEVARGNEDLSFRDAIREESGRLAGEEGRLSDPAYQGHHHRYHAYLGRGEYASQLERYFEAIGRSQVLVLESGLLARETQSCFDSITDFLGLSRLTLPSRDHHNARDYQSMADADRQLLADHFANHNERLYALLGTRYSWTTP
jgi:hypothetical protein